MSNADIMSRSVSTIETARLATTPEVQLSAIRLMHEFSRERQPLHCDVIIGKHYFLIKLDRISCTNYFMSIHNRRCRVKLIKIAKRDEKKRIFVKTHCVKDAGAEINSVGETGASCYRGIGCYRGVLCKTITLLAKSPTVVVSTKATTDERKPSMHANDSRYGQKSLFIHLKLVYASSQLSSSKVNQEEWFVKSGTYVLYIMSHNIIETMHPYVHRCRMLGRLSKKHGLGASCYKNRGAR